MMTSFTISQNGKSDGPTELFAYNVPCIKVLSGHLNSVLCVGIMPDGNTIISGSTDYTVKLWDSQTGLCAKTFMGH